MHSNFKWIKFLCCRSAFWSGISLAALRRIDLTKTYVFKQTSFVSEVVVEEVADRVIAKMITMVQEEVQRARQW